MPPKKSISQLHVERGVSKATLTKIEQFLDKDAESATEPVLEMRLESLARANANFTDVQSQIYALIDPENSLSIFAEQNEVMDFNERVINAEFRINTLLKSFKSEPKPTQTSDSDDQVSKLATVIAEVLSKRENSHSKKAKLPDLNIPKFSGKYTEWQSFKDLYVCSVHDNDELTNVQRFQYLRGLVEGEAAGVIKHLPTTEGNYEKAWELIEKRFNKQQCILFSHIDTFFGQQNVPDNSPILLRKLLNTTLETINAVDALGHKERDVWLVNYILRKVDKETHSLWTREFSQSQVPSWDEFQDFLEKRCDSVEASTSKIISSNREKQDGSSKGAKPSKPYKTTLAVSIKNCEMCHQGAHYSYQCPKFQSAAPAQRLQLVKKAKLCLNCLRDSHATEACQGSSCRRCQVKHNTLLHDAFVTPSGNSQVSPEAAVEPVPSSSGGAQASLVSNLQRKVISKQILLPTATILVKGGDGRLHKCRALLDSCSQTNFVTSSFVQKTRLRTFPQGNHVVSGIGQHKTSASNSTHFSFSSQDGNFTMDLDFLVLDSIVDDQPSSTFEVFWHIPAGIQLADFEYNIRSRVDVLLGAEVFMKALRSGRLEGSPTLQETAFGYIVAGSTPCESTTALASSCISTCLCSSNKSDSLHQQMEQFWTVEEPPIPEKILSKEEQLCETHFTQHTTRDSDGRFIVRLPIRDNLETLGQSESLALKRFFCTEKKLQHNPDHREKYVAFIHDYESLGHMRPLPETYHSDQPPVYLPQHPVFKTLTPTPVRVVFDASVKTSSRVSPNVVFMVGFKTQDNLFAILLRFRGHDIVIKADVKGMLCQVRVHSDNQNMQHIFRREAPDLPMKTYLLSTVTYGTGSASYLSKRCINKLVEEDGDNFPVARVAASRDFYVDDFISDAQTVAEAQELQSQIDLLMRRGGFQLSKWMSNSSEALKDVPLSEREITEPLDPSSTETISALGLQWNPVSGEFTFKVCLHSQTITKRAILSEMSRIFDPLGLLAPVTIQAKILMQSHWLVKADWDDELQDTTVLQTWQEYQHNLKDLTEFRIPRHITSVHQPLHMQLSVFCDVSEKAFGTCIYLQAIDPVSGNQLTSRLLCAKTCVAPLKQVSLPRLELCGALLAMKFLKGVQTALTVRVDSIAAFTDSIIVLCWLSSEPKRWQTFVANKVSKIQSILPRENWFHVPSSLNPTNLTSRGLSPSKLKDNTLWWSGPNTKVVQENREIPSIQMSEVELEQKVVCAVATRNSFRTIINKFSLPSKIIRSLSIWRRYIRNLRSRIRGEDIKCGPFIPGDFTALMPGHFIIGAPFNALPEHDITALSKNRLDKGQRNQKFVQHLWRRFHTEVFSQLQQRKKWQYEQLDLQMNDLVVILEDKVPLFSWIFYRIIEVHLGRDGHVQVAKVNYKGHHPLGSSFTGGS